MIKLQNPFVEQHNSPQIHLIRLFRTMHLAEVALDIYVAGLLRN